MRSGNDKRSDVKNPTSKDYKSAQDNRSNQLNPNHGASKGDVISAPGSTPDRSGLSGTGGNDRSGSSGGMGRNQ